MKEQVVQEVWARLRFKDTVWKMRNDLQNVAELKASDRQENPHHGTSSPFLGKSWKAANPQIREAQSMSWIFLNI